jgi:hypothetical protein
MLTIIAKASSRFPYCSVTLPEVNRIWHTRQTSNKAIQQSMGTSWMIGAKFAGLLVCPFAPFAVDTALPA